MNTKYMLLNALALSAMFLTGCNSTDIKATMNSGDAVSTHPSYHAKAVSAEQVKIYHSTSKTPKNHIVLGRVSASNHTFLGMTISQESIMAELKKQAGSMGANGITHITTGFAQTTAEAIRTK